MIPSHVWHPSPKFPRKYRSAFPSFGETPLAMSAAASGMGRSWLLLNMGIMMSRPAFQERCVSPSTTSVRPKYPTFIMGSISGTSFFFIHGFYLV